jgi:glycosyltransferase involved in cell wall biosynthesis
MKFVDRDRYPFLSVVIPARNEERTIGKCLQSIADQTYPADRIEVIVVDGRSTDATREIVRRFAAADSCFTLLDNPERITPVARNLGVRRARGEVIAIIDGHCWLDRRFLEKGVEALHRTCADCVGGLLINVAESRTGQAIALVMNSPFGVGNSASRALAKPGFVDHVSFPLYRRRVFEKVGYFDPSMIRNQDDEFNYRLRAHGGRIFFSPEIRAYYWVRESLRALWRQYFGYGRYKVEVVRRYPKQMQLRQFLPPAFVGGMLLGIALSPFWMPARAITAGALLLYAGYVVLGTAVLTRRGRASLLPIVPLVFATLHVSYGLGFLAGAGERLLASASLVRRNSRG